MHRGRRKMMPSIISGITGISGVSGGISTFVSNVEAYPLLLMRFLVPVVLLFVATLAVQFVSRREKVDSAPTTEQKREQFTIPDDFYNMEVAHIRKDDYGYFLKPMEIQFARIRETMEQFKALDKLYRKYDSKTRSASKRKREKAVVRRKEVFDHILELYNYLRNLQLETVEFDESSKVRKQ